jgi:DNA-binding protein Fis
LQRTSSRAADNPTLNLKVKFLRELAQSLLEELRALGGSREVRVEQGIDLYDEVSRFEIELIRCALQHTGGHQVRAARLLGLKTTTLNNKIKHYKIPVNKEAEAAVEQRPPRKPAGKAAGKDGVRKLPGVAARRHKEDAHLVG